MNSDRQEGERGAFITPSPRRSIHSYSDDMGHYGLNTSNDRSKRTLPPPKEQIGFDVVDNIMSKPARETSPLFIRNKKIHRTNSYPMDEETNDSSNLLSKSVPSILPSHLSSSDDTDFEESNILAGSKHENSFQCLSKINNSSSSHINTTLERSDMSWNHQSFSNLQTSRNERQTKTRTESNSSQIPITLIFGLFIGFLAVLYYNVDFKSSIIQSLQYSSYYKSTKTINNDVIFERNMRDLQEKYNIDNDSILKLKVGISTISSKMDAGSFVFVYDSNSGDFDPLQFDKFINEVASAAAKYLRNESSSNKHTVLSSNLDMEKHGELIDMYRDAVDKTGVLLVKEVDTVPSNLAMAFHYYCDEYEPLVKRSAIFFTLNLANCSNSGEKKSTHDFIEKCLAGKWNTVPEDNIRPLLTRLVNVVIDVTRVF